MPCYSSARMIEYLRGLGLFMLTLWCHDGQETRQGTNFALSLSEKLYPESAGRAQCEFTFRDSRRCISHYAGSKRSAEKRTDAANLTFVVRIRRTMIHVVIMHSHAVCVIQLDCKKCVVWCVFVWYLKRILMLVVWCYHNTIRIVLSRRTLHIKHAMLGKMDSHTMSPLNSLPEESNNETVL
jgi:hypothetical protein